MRISTITASTKRAGSIEDGKEQSAETIIESLSCTPIDPVDPNIELGIEGVGWREVRETFVDDDLDIRDGDLFIVGTDEYLVRAVSEWNYRNSVYLHIILEEQK